MYGPLWVHLAFYVLDVLPPHYRRLLLSNYTRYFVVWLMEPILHIIVSILLSLISPSIPPPGMIEAGMLLSICCTISIFIVFVSITRKLIFASDQQTCLSVGQALSTWCWGLVLE